MLAFRCDLIRSLIFIVSPVLLIFLGHPHPISSYHDPTSENVFYHCWWENASQTNPFPIPCDGISIQWVIKPPRQVAVNEPFNVSYKLVVEEQFYQSRFGFDFPEYKNISASSDLVEFCKNSRCPAKLAETGPQFSLDCCVWHANVHVCHPGDCGTPTDICGPWVDNDQLQSTHTVATYGNIQDTFSTNMFITVPKFNHLIAHVKLGRLQMAIQEIVLVSKYYCGDGKCTDDETCDSCQKDCCTSLPPYAIVLIIVFILCGLILLVCVAIGCFFYRRRKLLYDESWIINISKIEGAVQGYKGISSLVSIHNLLLFNGEGYNMEGGNRSSCASDYNVQKKASFKRTGVYEGRRVYLKKIPKREILLTKQIRTEVMQIRMIDHPNLCKFIGATLNNPDNMFIVTEYCSKGSLNDVLQNEDIPLNWGFRLSFATDIARGMVYLHNKRLYHGRLSSSNCVIDGRWVVKISDYGLSSFQASGSRFGKEEEGIRRMMQIYLAPEIRRQQIFVPSASTDVYSYSIILLEIATRTDPYSEHFATDSNGTPIPPDLSTQDCPCPDQYIELMSHCWDSNPTNRLTFEQAKKSLHKMNPQKESPVDMMMIMMEKYSNNLEVLVSERTQELIAEQNKTANLLYSMLPRQVADELRHGRPVAAQEFQSATIFFSDIVGFTSLACTSTPMEVVTMLNELYSIFDDILDTFDVYKVETIGDAYMVVSGVPRENGDQHAGEIARMALKLIAATKAFKIPHRPDDKLQIRVGIHSGPVCAGVVGVKMPRYCLFGDTVNTASRMESTSEAMHIQCSNSTYQLLKKGFILECRGSIDIKGKGMMTTWWLNGQLDYIATPTTNSTCQYKRSPSPCLRSYSSTGSCEMLLFPNKQTPTLLNGNEIFPSSNKQSSPSLRSSELLSSPKLRKSITLLNHVFNLPGSLS